MKTVKWSFAALILIVLSSYTYNRFQEPDTTGAALTETIQVWGNCNMCKALIEEAAKDEIPSRAMVVNGVYNADWNEATKILTLVYNPRLVTSEEVQRKIAEAGYDTEKFKADDRAYAKLPECCKYNRKK